MTMMGFARFCVSGAWPEDVAAKLLDLSSARNGSAPSEVSKGGNARKSFRLRVLNLLRLKRAVRIAPVDGGTV